MAWTPTPRKADRRPTGPPDRSPKAGPARAALRDVDPARFETFRARWIGNDPVSFAWTYRMLVHMDIRETIARIRCPTLGIGGTLDTFRPPEYVRSVLSPIPKLEFAEIETSHHQPTQTPEAIGVLLHRFFAGHAAGHVEGAAR